MKPTVRRAEADTAPWYNVPLFAKSVHPTTCPVLYLRAAWLGAQDRACLSVKRNSFSCAWICGGWQRCSLKKNMRDKYHIGVFNPANESWSPALPLPWQHTPPHLPQQHQDSRLQGPSVLCYLSQPKPFIKLK